MHRDLVLRWLEQLSLLIRRLLYGPGPVDIELAEQHLAEAMQQHLGPMAQLVQRLDPASAANLLHDPDRILGYAELVGLEAQIREKRGEDVTALRQREAALRGLAEVRSKK